MPYIHEHIETKVLNAGQKNQYESFIATVWTGVVGDVTEAVIAPQPGNNIIATVTGTKTVANAALLPPAPFELLSSDGGYTYLHVDRVALSAPQLGGMNGFINSAWPGHQDDVNTIRLRSIDVEGSPEIEAVITGTLTVQNANQLPPGRVRVREIT
jgi:hypothetical protein